MSSENKIVRRYYIEADARLETPLSISNGLDENTDTDVLKNADGEPFIPGTSIAGAFRNYIRIPKDTPCFFGHADGEDGKMSSVWIMDSYLKDFRVSVRDGVSLDEKKAVNNKFNYEVVESGAVTTLRMEKIVRQNDITTKEQDDGKNCPKDAELAEIRLLLTALHNGEIRLGFKKNRGFGWIVLTSVRMACFSKENIEKWMDYCSRPASDKGSRLPEWKDWEIQQDKEGKGKPDGRKFVSIQVPLKLVGGICIRKYSAMPNEVDFEHITVQQNPGKDGEAKKIPVIPGTSWNGAIRASVRNILKELHVKEVGQWIDRWFGCVETTRGKQSAQNAWQSMVVLKESAIKGSVPVPVTRNKINRFDASTVDGALYSERTYFGGETTLEILISKKEDDYYKALVGILLLVIEELEEGFLAVGGQSAVGKGIFKRNGETVYSGEIASEEQRAACIRELADCLKPPHL